MQNTYLAHHGIKGMKWGVRRSPEELGRRKAAKARYKETKALARDFNTYDHRRAVSTWKANNAKTSADRYQKKFEETAKKVEGVSTKTSKASQLVESYRSRKTDRYYNKAQKMYDSYKKNTAEANANIAKQQKIVNRIVAENRNVKASQVARTVSTYYDGVNYIAITMPGVSLEAVKPKK